MAFPHVQPTQLQPMAAVQPPERLLEQIRCGDEAALSQLYDQCAPALFAFLLRRGYPLPEAEARLQQAFLQACREIHTYRPGTIRPETWLLRMALRVRG
ncbi:MAG TPA: sigma factor [Chitinophagaceae bacterium]|nr:sigma factor [Chitinophagaceae bacterium]